MATSHLYCSTCGAANAQHDVYCFACGKPLKATTSIRQYPTAVSPSSNQTGLLTLNHLLKQRYRLLAQLGKGGFGAVYKAEDTKFGNRLVAVKEMSQSRLSSQQEIDEATKAFEREAFMLANLRHQNLPRIYDHFSDGGRWYLVMDFIEGETLQEYLNKARGRLSFEQMLQIGIQLCTILDYLHTRQPPIIFRDLTPTNIMLTLDEHVYLIDFGIARHFKPGQAKDTTAFGSPGYASPEQYGNAQTTPRSDIYSLGAIFHHILTGVDPSQKPFRFTLPQLSRPDIPSNLSILIMQMLDMDESRRPVSMTTIKKALQQIAAQLAGKTPLSTTQLVGGKPLSPIQHTLGGKGIFGIIASIVAIILVVAFITSAVSTHFGQSSSQISSDISSTTTSASAPAPTPTTPSCIQ